jgi:hypothetical protein
MIQPLCFDGFPHGTDIPERQLAVAHLGETGSRNAITLSQPGFHFWRVHAFLG